MKFLGPVAVILCCAVLGVAAMAAEPVATWDFETPGDNQGWAPNASLKDIAIEEGVVSGVADGSDSFFLNRDIDIEASPHYYVELRIRADRGGTGKLYWSQALEGQHGGLSEDRALGFEIEGTGDWETVVILPFWQNLERIHQMRINIPYGVRFVLDSIRVLDWRDQAEEAAPGQRAWDAEDIANWWQAPQGRILLTPLDNLDADEHTWASLELQSEQEGLAAVVWASENSNRLQYEYFPVEASDSPQSYVVELAGLSAWKTPIIAFGVSLPAETPATLHAVRLSAEPTGPARLEAPYFGFENSPNRIGMEAPVLLRVENRGGSDAKLEQVELVTPDGLEIVKAPQKATFDSIPYGEFRDLIWRVKAQADATSETTQDYEVAVEFAGEDAPDALSTTLSFTPALNLPPADYVPEPQPIETTQEIAAYYFPGWESPAKWQPVQYTAPIRKPMLGYYDEGNPEVVDWQIKWAVENGISTFLVDWYWIDGSRHLEHWFEAYREARYRDYLNVAIMWANHNPPDTHSHEDWVRVTKHWIEHYFSMDSYYQIDGKPAVFIWDPRNIRSDLGGSEAVRAAFDESQRLAQEAGFEGIYFAALFGHESKDLVEMLEAEGYHGTTTYHEWGDVSGSSTDFRREDFEEVVQTAPDHWQEKLERAEPLDYFPVATTGWDSRPWHGDASLVIANRTPERFERLLRLAKDFCAQNAIEPLVIGPLNEWGEGSYIEPALQYGFGMYEAIRTVFGKGDPEDWPVNIAPLDVELGPYDMTPQETKTAWTFSEEDHGWATKMGLSEVRRENGQLHGRSTSYDPAFDLSFVPVSAGDFVAAEVEMQVVGENPGQAQLFWAANGRSISQSTSVSIPLETDGAMHTYRVSLADQPRWRGQITGLRFDPCSRRDIDISINAFRLVPAED